MKGLLEQCFAYLQNEFESFLAHMKQMAIT